MEASGPVLFEAACGTLALSPLTGRLSDHQTSISLILWSIFLVIPLYVFLWFRLAYFCFRWKQAGFVLRLVGRSPLSEQETLWSSNLYFSDFVKYISYHSVMCISLILFSRFVLRLVGRSPLSERETLWGSVLFSGQPELWASWSPGHPEHFPHLLHLLPSLVVCEQSSTRNFTFTAKSHILSSAIG